MSYCDTIEEHNENPLAKQWIYLCANGNKSAEEFLLACWHFEHMFDDLIDKDKIVTHEKAHECLIEFLGMISFNPFYQQYKQVLFGFLVSLANRDLDGNEWELNEDPNKKIQGAVIRCGDIELALTVAYLCGGWEHMRKLKTLRSYDKVKEK